MGPLAARLEPALIVLLAIVIALFADAGLTLGDDASDGRAAGTPVATPPAGPLKLLFTRRGPEVTDQARAYTVLQDGTKQTPAAGKAVRPDQMSDTSIVYVKDTRRPGYLVRHRIAMARLDGSDPSLLSQGYEDVDPRFSPNAFHVAYRTHLAPKGSTQGSGNDFFALALLNLVTGKARLVGTPKGTSIRDFAFSPSGKEVVVLRERIDVNINYEPEMFIVNLATGKERRLTTARFGDGIGDYSQMSWSHDGRHIVAVVDHVKEYGNFSGYQEDSRFLLGNDLWIIPVDGSGARRITHLAPREDLSFSFCMGSGGVLPRLYTPMWSPDDSKIAFMSSYPHVAEGSRVSDLMVVRPDGGGMRTVRKTAPATCTGPQFGKQRSNPEFVELLGWVR